MAEARNLLSLILRDMINFSSDSSDEEFDILALHSNAIGAPNLWSGDQRPRIHLYTETTVRLYSDYEFKSHFRLERVTFFNALGLIAPMLVSKQTSAGRPGIEPEKPFLIALWTMATPDSYRSICDRFDVGRATAVRAVRRVTEALFEIAPTIVEWPRGDMVTIVKEGFKKGNNFPGVIGAIDGTFINIPAPKVHPESYINRKKRHAIVLQAVCDHEGVYTHAYAGEVGSVHDARIFRKSELFEYTTRDSASKFPTNTSNWRSCVC